MRNIAGGTAPGSKSGRRRVARIPIGQNDLLVQYQFEKAQAEETYHVYLLSSATNLRGRTHVENIRGGEFGLRSHGRLSYASTCLPLPTTTQDLLVDYY